MTKMLLRLVSTAFHESRARTKTAKRFFFRKYFSETIFFYLHDEMNNRDLVNCKSSLDGRERYLVQKYDMPTVSEGHIELHRPHKAYLGLFRETLLNANYF